MMYVVIGRSAGKTREEVMAVYPRHKEFADKFIENKEVVGMGPFFDPEGGNMAIFRTKDAAERFAKSDPFYTEGLVSEYKIKQWGDEMIS